MEHERRIGPVIPRDYGIVLRKPGRPPFISPSRLAMGALHLMDQPGTHKMLANYAEAHEEDLGELKQAWRKGLQARHDATPEAIASQSGLNKIWRYGSDFRATVASRSGGEARLPSLSVNGDRFGCTCPDNSWNDSKGLDVLCSHVAALALALSRDKRGRKSSSENYTGLTSTQLAVAPDLFFQYTGASIAELIVGYVAKGVNHFALNREALTHPEIYSDALAARVRRGAAQFMVLPQNAPVVDRKELSEKDDAFLAACQQLEKRLRTELVDRRSFTEEGYSLLFGGGPWQAVARRFRNGNLVFEIARYEGQAPLVVRKDLRGLSRNWTFSEDDHTQEPNKRQPYESIDDATRRHAQVSIVRPDVDLGVAVQRILEPAYRR